MTHVSFLTHKEITNFIATAMQTRGIHKSSQLGFHMWNLIRPRVYLLSCKKKKWNCFESQSDWTGKGKASFSKSELCVPFITTVYAAVCTQNWSRSSLYVVKSSKDRSTLNKNAPTIYNTNIHESLLSIQYIQGNLLVNSVLQGNLLVYSVHSEELIGIFSTFVRAYCLLRRTFWSIQYIQGNFLVHSGELSGLFSTFMRAFWSIPHSGEMIDLFNSWPHWTVWLETQTKT